jgi:hypothetical protein
MAHPASALAGSLPAKADSAQHLRNRLLLAATVSLTGIAFVFALSVSGCARGGKTATFGSGEDMLGYGEYSAQKVDATGHMTRIKLNQNNSYVKKKYLGPCLLVESKGEWEATTNLIEFRLQEIRQRSSCETEQWVIEKSDRRAERNLRNVTPNSFELLDQEENSSAEWVKFVKP